jgi:hypothetical protein
MGGEHPPGFGQGFLMKKRIRRRKIIVLCLLGLVLTVCGGGFASVEIWPSLGAQGADFLRGIIGDPAVAWLEGEFFQVHDALMQLAYGLGARPAAPWTNGAASTAPESNSGSPAITSASPTPEATAWEAGGSPTPTATPVRWPPPEIPALGTLAGEGIWSLYLTNALGQAVAYRTFLQPDADRPYAIAAIVAVDLDKIRLQYVLGFEEPYFKEPVDVKRSGAIPKQDKQPGILLAVFNGGFLTRHGIFGVMVDGLGTLAIYPDHRVRIGVWGKDITSLEGASAVRQNGPIVVQDGVINPQAFENSWDLWGASLSGDMATWRSAVGISADGRTLFYVAGWSLNMPALARALQTAGVDSAIQLDINRYWVLFAAIRFDQDVPKAVPLLDEMNENVDRYLYASSRDFFYLAARTE